MAGRDVLHGELVLFVDVRDILDSDLLLGDVGGQLEMTGLAGGDLDSCRTCCVCCQPRVHKWGGWKGRGCPICLLLARGLGYSKDIRQLEAVRA